MFLSLTWNLTGKILSKTERLIAKICSVLSKPLFFIATDRLAHSSSPGREVSVGGTGSVPGGSPVPAPAPPAGAQPVPAAHPPPAALPLPVSAAGC